MSVIGNPLLIGSSGSSGGSAVTVTDTLDSAGGTIRTITAVDLSNDTVSASNLLYPYTAHDSSGNAITGEYVPSSITLQSKTATPTTSSQTITPDSGYDGLSSVAISAMPSGTAGTPTATKGTVSGNAISVTPSVTNTTGYISGSTITGTAVSVSASELVSGTLAITANGTADVTNYASVSVDVPSGGSSTVAEESDVNFIDYDGTILYSYTASDFANLSALPGNPSHSGLTAQGWNWSLSDAKTYVANYGKLWIGQMYVTSSGNTEIDIVLGGVLLSPYLGIAVNGTVVVDWGDNSTDTITGTSLTTQIRTQHNYASTGSYTITISVTSGSFAFYGTSGYSLLNHNSSTALQNVRYANTIKAVRIGTGITTIGNYAFQYCCSLSSITIPSSVTSITSYAFQRCNFLSSITIPPSMTSIGTYVLQYCYSLSTITIPSNVTSIGNYTFHSCYSLSTITIPSSVTIIRSYVFYACYSLSTITIPSSVTSIEAYGFYNCYGLEEIHFKSTTPPTLSNSNAFTNLPTDCIIYVPSGYLSDYTSATNYPSSSTYTYVEE